MTDQYIADYAPYVREKWKTDELFALLRQYEDDLEKASAKTEETEKYKLVLLHIIGKSLVTAREIIAICEAGYTDGAFSLSRNLFEQMIHVLFFQVHENDPEFENYLDDYKTNISYQFYKYNITRAKQFQLDTKDLDLEYEELKKQSKHKFPEKIDRNQDYWWAGVRGFRGLAKDVKEHRDYQEDKSLIDNLFLFYDASCIYLHANAAGNSTRLGRGNEYLVIDTSRGLDGQCQPLYFATMCLCIILLRGCQMFQMNFTYYKERINQLIAFYQDGLIQMNS